jgi:putative ABC transport system permease protein
VCDFAFWFCPREFRQAYRDQVQLEIAEGRPLLRAAADVVVTGLSMHAENLWRDLSFAARMLLKSPLYSLVAVGAIALAIGANVAVASTLSAVLFKPLPYAQADRLVFVGEDESVSSGSPYPDARMIERSNQTFAAFAAVMSDTKTLTGQGPPRRIRGSDITPGYFDVFAAPPVMGRAFTQRDIGSANVIISEPLWRTAFGGDARVVGRPIALNLQTYRIVGVARAGFTEASSRGTLTTPDFWLPIDPNSPFSGSGAGNFTLVARLRDGVSAAAARADMIRIMPQVVRSNPGFHGNEVSHPVVQSMLDSITAPVATLLWLVYAAVAAVLIIACANVANLSLVRVAGRQSELAVRAALGAAPGRIVAQVATEAGLLAFIGAGAGVFVGWLGLLSFTEFGAGFLPRWNSVTVDAGVLGYVLALVVITTLTTGTLPALLYRRNISSSLRTAQRADKSATKRVRAVLVIAEIALALAIVVSAGLVVRSFVTLTHAKLGFDATNTYVLQGLGLSGPRYREPTARANVARMIGAKLHALPGVTDVASAGAVPFTGLTTSSFVVPGTKIAGSATFSIVDREFFGALRIAALRGRTFTAKDRLGSQPVIVINATFARKYFGTLDVIGKHINPGAGRIGSEPAVRTIVGIVADTRRSFSVPYEPTMYFPLAQYPLFSQTVVRTDGHADLGRGIAAVFASIDPLMPTPIVVSYQTLFARDVVRSQASTILFTMLGAIALALALAGIYAVSSYTVQQRGREFGIRKAIGAGNSTIIFDVLGKAAGQSVIGIALGLVFAAAATRLLDNLLYQTSPLDSLTFGSAIALLAACTLVAALVPALRAARADPSVTLRYE